MSGVDDAMMAIIRDKSISREEKLHKVRELHRQRSDPMLFKNSENAVEKDLEPTFHDDSEKVLGCKHYKRACKVRCNECKRFYTCRHCHDRAHNHKMKRKEVTTMLCMYCKKTQPVAQDCKYCNKRMARYFCKICNLFDDECDRDIYHCDECGLCRRGKREDYFHCKTCGTCVSIEIKKEHKCYRNSIAANCPVCGEFMFDSTKLVRFLHCGHCMHAECYEKYARYNYTCPICRKSLTNMSTVFSHIERAMSAQRMPEELKNHIAKIYCNDCEKKSNAPYHFLYHKCRHCGSFNTQLLSKEAPSVTRSTSV
mmetsp:Transcript_2827/g.4106  ORF Transcript_2827/g.4106 Transcript_2827/m.4106 type:complete len:311 (-) Transcript_2827:145-1077(-)